MKCFWFFVYILMIGFNFFQLTDGKKVLNEYPEPSTEKRIFAKLNRPFRMEKLNIVWTKAQPVSVVHLY